VDVLLRGVAVARRQVPHLVLLVAGPDFGQEAALRALTHELGLGDSVRFMGLVDAAMRAKLLAAVDLLAVVARHGENFCLAAAEAMAAGVPVLVSNHTGSCCRRRPL
jgi:glycosyltransferase involved in cell wall biosynthesis